MGDNVSNAGNDMAGNGRNAAHLPYLNCPMSSQNLDAIIVESICKFFDLYREHKANEAARKDNVIWLSSQLAKRKNLTTKGTASSYKHRSIFSESRG